MLKFGLSLFFTAQGRNSGLAQQNFTTKNAENH
jgi:hypothetical protein